MPTLLATNAQWLIADGYKKEAEELLELALQEKFYEHNFVFNGKKYKKPNIYEIDYEALEPSTQLAGKLTEIERIVSNTLTQYGFSHSPGAAIKLQRNDGGAFPLHYDNPGPPNNRGMTAILYLGLGDGSPWLPDNGGTLELRPFLRQGISIAPKCGRLVLFQSDRVLHAVAPWHCTHTSRFAVSFWFDYTPEQKAKISPVLTRSHLSNFRDWNQAVFFFQDSELQRFLSRAVYHDEYITTLHDCGFNQEATVTMHSDHQTTVESLTTKLRPLINQLTERKCKVLPPSPLQLYL